MLINLVTTSFTLLSYVLSSSIIPNGIPNVKKAAHIRLAYARTLTSMPNLHELWDL
jgi:hypothetical protein